MTRADADHLTNEETAQRRDAIVRVMANTAPQPRAAQQHLKARRKATSTASDRKAASADAAASS